MTAVLDKKAIMRDKRAQGIAAMGLVNREGDRFRVTTPTLRGTSRQLRGLARRGGPRALHLPGVRGAVGRQTRAFAASTSSPSSTRCREQEYRGRDQAAAAAEGCRPAGAGRDSRERCCGGDAQHRTTNRIREARRGCRGGQTTSPTQSAALRTGAERAAGSRRRRESKSSPRRDSSAFARGTRRRQRSKR